MVRPRILVVTKNLPWPANSGEKMRTRGIVRALAQEGEVTVVGFVGEHEDASLATDDHVAHRAVPLRRPGPWRWLLNSLRLRSITAGKWADAALREAVSEELGRGMDIVVVEHVQLAPYLPAHRSAGTLTVLDMHNIESQLTARLADTVGLAKKLVYRVEAAALRRHERRAVASFDVVAVVSEVDRSTLATLTGVDDVVVVPNAIDVTRTALPPAETPTASFVGMLSWEPNARAAVNLVTQVWPAVRAQVPGATLLLVGRDPGPEVRALAGDDVVVTGTVDDLVPYYARSRIALAPLLAGGGSRLKILESLAYGRAVVATRIGAEGLEDLLGRGVLACEDNDSLAREMVRLLRDPEASVEAGLRGYDAVRTEHSWASATLPLRERIAAVAS